MQTEENKDTFTYRVTFAYKNLIYFNLHDSVADFQTQYTSRVALFENNMYKSFNRVYHIISKVIHRVFFCKFYWQNLASMVTNLEYWKETFKIVWIVYFSLTFYLIEIFLLILK